MAALRLADVSMEGYMCNCQVPALFSTMRFASPLEWMECPSIKADDTLH